MSTIGLNAHLLNLSGSYRSAGIHRYVYQMLLHLPVEAPHNRYLAYVNEPRLTATHPAMQVRRTRWPAHHALARIAWEQSILPLVTIADRLDLLHALAFVRPAVARCPVVVTVYDLSFVHLPERFPILRRLYLRAMTRYSARRAARVVTISQSTKDDVVRFCQVPPGRVSVVYCGVEDDFQPLGTSEIEAFRSARGLPRHFILFVGTLEPRKNLAHLVRAFAALPRNGSERPKLVIAGARGWGYADFEAAVEQSGAGGDIVMAGYIPPGELPLWYNAADLFIYPSVFEGFGLPVLEAMACGTPAITSDVPSLAEAAGDAALTVSPTDTRAISDAIQRVLHDRGLHARMRERGLRHSRQFSWRRAARETAQVYEQVLA